MRISKVVAREISDSRGDPTLEVDVFTPSGFGRAAAPSGASKGKYEAIAYPKEVSVLVNYVNSNLATKLLGEEANYRVIDRILKNLDGTKNFSKIGGNVAIALSLATARASAIGQSKELYEIFGNKIELPYPLGNVLGGGAHSGGKSPDIQEFLVIPLGAANICEAIFTNALVHKRVREILIEKGKVFGRNDEGAWTSDLTNREALDIVSRAAKDVEQETAVKIALGLDVAASELYSETRDEYVYPIEEKKRHRGAQIDYIKELVETYKIFYVEDALHEDDFDGFAELTKKIGKECLVVGDDLFVTNSSRLKQGIKVKAGNALIVKPNQIGTLSDVVNVIRLAKDNGYIPVMSHRSGETTDTSIAHLAVGLNCPIIKTGVTGGERIAKLNELVRIGEKLEMPKMAKIR